MFYSYEEALTFVNQNDKYPLVIKADGLALGKGVIIAQDKLEALNALNLMMKEKVFGKAGEKIVIEDYLKGEEISVLSSQTVKTLCL